MVFFNAFSVCSSENLKITRGPFQIHAWPVYSIFLWTLAINNFMIIMRYGCLSTNGNSEGDIVLCIVLLYHQSKLPPPFHYEDNIFHAIRTTTTFFDYRLLKNSVPHLRHPGNDLYFRTGYIFAAFVVDDNIKSINSHLHVFIFDHHLYSVQPFRRHLDETLIMALFHFMAHTVIGTHFRI